MRRPRRKPATGFVLAACTTLAALRDPRRERPRLGGQLTRLTLFTNRSTRGTVCESDTRRGSQWHYGGSGHRGHFPTRCARVCVRACLFCCAIGILLYSRFFFDESIEIALILANECADCYSRHKHILKWTNGTEQFCNKKRIDSLSPPLKLD